MQAISFSLKTAFRLRRELNTISCTSPLDVVLFVQGERKDKNLYHHLLTDTLFWYLICCFAYTTDLLQVNSLTKVFVMFTFTRIHKIINKASAMKLQIHDPPNQCKWKKQHLAVKHELLQKVYWLEGFNDGERRKKKREKSLNSPPYSLWAPLFFVLPATTLIQKKKKENPNLFQSNVVCFLPV